MLHDQLSVGTRSSLLVFAALALLGTMTSALAGYYHRERATRAVGMFERGEAAVTAGRPAAGIGELRAALALDRGNPRYSLVLADALLRAGRPREAETYLETAMKADPTSGPANLLNARIVRALQEPDAAVWYERALAGSWPDEKRGTRNAVGIEFAEYLLSLEDHERARTVLVRLSLGPSDPSGARVARLLLDAGAEADAARLARARTAAAPDDLDGWLLLAEAEFRGGRDREAQAAARRASTIDPGNARATEIARTTGTVLALDPFAPRLNAAERTRRARELLRAVVAAHDACMPPAGARTDDPVAAARRALQPGRARVTDAQDLADLATFAWALREARCGPPAPDLAGLARLLGRLDAGSALP